MPVNQFKKDINLDYLNPVFLQQLLDLLVEGKMQNYIYKVYSGYRSFDEQRTLYKLFLGGGAKAAPPGLSAHNYGLAVDCARLMPDGTVSWKDSDMDYLGVLAPKHGLDWGGRFADKPHLGMVNYVTGQQLLPLKIVYGAAPGTELDKLKCVWKEVK